MSGVENRDGRANVKYRYNILYKRYPYSVCVYNVVWCGSMTSRDLQRRAKCLPRVLVKLYIYIYLHIYDVETREKMRDMHS